MAISDQIDEQVILFSYLGINITSDDILTFEVQDQAWKATILANCMNDTIWDINIYETKLKPELIKTTDSDLGSRKRERL